MVFSDLFFIYVFLASFAIMYLLGTWADKAMSKDDTPACHVRNAVLVLFSLIFYAWGEPIYVFLMLVCVVINFFIGRMIDHQEKHRKAMLVIGVACDLGILGIFKYADFFANQLQALGIPVPSPHISLPIGISFYIFQSLSYLVDVYRRDSHSQKRFIDLLLYISMFPQLIAGPIVRYQTVAEKITKRHVTAEDLSDGIYRFLRGLAKKVIFANQLYEISHQFLDGKLEELSMAGAWIGIIAFTLQIYFDFSGYSDMAIGLGRCLGFRFNENFDHPYCSKSITEFWKRWHISLGSFFRDYVYIPMGGNRRHQAVNILVVWFLTGMWHGASWNFIFWGVLFGVFVTLEKYTLLKVINRIPSPLLHFYCLFVVVVSFGIFYFDDFTRLTSFFHRLWGGAETYWDVISEAAIFDHFWLWLAAVVFCMPIRKLVSDFFDRHTADKPVFNQTVNTLSRLVVSIAILIISTALLVGATNNAFIYTRF